MSMLIDPPTTTVEPEQVSCSSIGALDWTVQVPGPCIGTSSVAPAEGRLPTSAPLAAPPISDEAGDGSIAAVVVNDGELDLAVAVAVRVLGVVVIVVGTGSVGVVDRLVAVVVVVGFNRTTRTSSLDATLDVRATTLGGLETVKTRTRSRIGLDHCTRCAARSDVTRSIMNPRYRRGRPVAKLGEVMAAHTRNR